MLKVRDLDTKPASNRWFAARDADRYSEECRMLYTAREQATAETFKDLVELAYGGRIYLTYRITFASVKIDSPMVRDRVFLKELEALCEERGYEKVRTAQGISYRMPRFVQ